MNELIISEYDNHGEFLLSLQEKYYSDQSFFMLVTAIVETAQKHSIDFKGTIEASIFANELIRKNKENKIDEY